MCVCVQEVPDGVETGGRREDKKMHQSRFSEPASCFKLGGFSLRPCINDLTPAGCAVIDTTYDYFLCRHAELNPAPHGNVPNYVNAMQVLFRMPEHPWLLCIIMKDEWLILI